MKTVVELVARAREEHSNANCEQHSAADYHLIVAIEALCQAIEQIQPTGEPKLPIASPKHEDCDCPSCLPWTY